MFLTVTCVAHLCIALAAQQDGRRQDATPPPVVWVLAGQSNMEGNGYVETESADPSPVLTFGSRGEMSWKPAAEPLHSAKNPGQGAGWAAAPLGRPLAQPVIKGVGPGLTFARDHFARVKQPVGLIPCAVGGTSLAQWDPGKRADSKSLYGAMLAKVKASGAKVAGVLWYQGEADAVGGAESAASYGKRFEAFIAAVRADLGNPELPFVFAQLSRYVTSRAEWNDPWNMVQEAQRVLPARVPRTACVSTIDLSLDDPIHVSTDGERRLGRRMARAAAAIDAGAGATFGPRITGVAFVAGRRDEIIVSFEGVKGSLSTVASGRADAAPAVSQRVAGFSLAAKDGTPLDPPFDAALGADGKSVVLRLPGAAPDGATVWYGRGLNPFCNLVDGADDAVPVSGPLQLQ